MSRLVDHHQRTAVAGCSGVPFHVATGSLSILPLPGCGRAAVGPPSLGGARQGSGMCGGDGSPRRSVGHDRPGPRGSADRADVDGGQRRVGPAKRAISGLLSAAYPVRSVSLRAPAPPEVRPTAGPWRHPWRCAWRGWSRRRDRAPWAGGGPRGGERAGPPGAAGRPTRDRPEPVNLKNFRLVALNSG